MDSNKLDVLDKLVNIFRPVYYFHTAERFYPCDFGDVMKQCSLLYKDPQGGMKEIIPYPHLNNGTLHAEKDALTAEGISLEAKHVAALSWKPVDPALSPDADKYRYCKNQSGSYFFKLQNRDILPGNLTGGAKQTPTYFIDENRGGKEKPSYENGFPFCPEYWDHIGDDPDKICKTRAKEILDANKKLDFSPNPQYCSISQRVIRGERYTDFIYITYLAMNGSPSILPGVGTHIIDIEVVGVRFKGHDVSESSTPFRYYFAQHAGFSWYEPQECEFMLLTNPDGVKTNHLVAYFARECHEVYPHTGVWQRIYGFANDVCNQGVLWEPPAKYINIPTDQEATKIRTYYDKNNPYSVMLIPEETDGRGPEWYYSVTPAHLPGSEGMPACVRKKIELPESGVNGAELCGCENATTQAADHSEPGTYIDKAVPKSLEPFKPDHPCTGIDKSVSSPERADNNLESSQEIAAGKLSIARGADQPAFERTFLNFTRPPGTDVLESINNMILPQMSGENGFIHRIVPEALIDGYQPKWNGQSPNPQGMDHNTRKDYPIWYHKENCGPFDLQVWLHSTESLKKKHSGDEAKGYKGGIRTYGLEQLVFEPMRPGSATAESFKLRAMLPGGKKIKVTANAEIVTDKNRWGFSIGSPHAVATMTIDKLELEVECTLKVPVAITDTQVTRFCIDKDGNRTPPEATGWLVPNIQWPHGNNDEFEGITNAYDYCIAGLPPDAVVSQGEFKKLMNFSSKVKVLQKRFTVDIEFIGLLQGNFKAAKEFADFLQTGKIGDIVSTLFALADLPFYFKFFKRAKKALKNILNLIKVPWPAPIDLILADLAPKLERLLDDEMNKRFNHPPSI